MLYRFSLHVKSRYLLEEGAKSMTLLSRSGRGSEF